MLEHNDRFSLNSLFENFTEESEELEDDISSDNEGSDCEFFGSFADFDECNIRFLHRISENIDVTSSSDFNIYEDEINEDLECENECNNEQSPCNNNNEYHEIIADLELKDLTACVVIDFINGKFQQCGQNEGKIRQLRNLFGTWQIDRDAVKEVNGILPRLGVCDSHFQFDNKYLHKPREKKFKDFESGIIQWCRCMSCDKFVNFFSRGMGCAQHSWYINKHNIQVSCIGQYGCEALKKCDPLCVQAFDNIKRSRSICCSCYEKLGGHIYQRPGRGKKGKTCVNKQLHLEDISKGLEFLDEELKKQILVALVNTFIPFAPHSYYNKETNNPIPISTSKITQPPSLFLIKMLFIKFFKKINDNPKINIDNFKELGRFAFPSLKIWLSRVLASLVRRPQLLSSLRQLLTMCHVTSHTDRYERKLANVRMKNANPTQRLIKKNNIWNLAIIDNIDFKEKSFKFENIYDVTRESSHAILRIAFQIQLPIDIIRTGPEEMVELTADTPLFGMNSRIDQLLMTFQEVFKELLDFKNINGELSYRKDFDAKSVKDILLSKLDYGCLEPSPNVVILEPGNNLNSDEEILNAAEMYKKEFDLKDYEFLDIVADEAIYRRLIKCKKKWTKLRPHLGQWHTSKDFYSVLLVLFSSYGLLSLASRLSVRFLDKLEIDVDYRSTARVLDLLWVAVGIAINIYINLKKINFSEILDGKNDTHICLKVWYLYYRWAGIWKAHKMGMRIGNFSIQKDSLAAAAPLFASAAKSNYTTAIAHYLSTLAAFSQLEEKLRCVGSFKIPREQHEENHICLGFDEALETFGVKYVKQNVIGNTIDEKCLKDQIKAVQDERARIDLLIYEYLDNKSILPAERTSKSRMAPLWDLVGDLVDIFGMSDPLSHDLFQEYQPTELHHQGVERLISCYQKGLARAIEVVRIRLKDFTQQKKNRQTKVKLSQSTSRTGGSRNADNLELSHLPNDQISLLKKKCKQTTPEKEKILEALLVYEDELPDSAINEVLDKLSSDWNKTKVKAAWRYRKSKIQIINNNNNK
ncbi:hypothetical protein RhiirC2_769934 [Rhizophagus irregularis]|uniref:Uncharacterized protein n=1 Tax=Rhizophagus irregularis TaxID=588596 RepID=A0A2N1MRV0_9GLOM|nr:hypothetical protein RhiirC2_787607 [Rhizophagus irregularis]PKK78688.1 hypothetical protein RhiirC2_769934 [Rhizophagus irregularis]